MFSFLFSNPPPPPRFYLDAPVQTLDWDAITDNFILPQGSLCTSFALSLSGNVRTITKTMNSKC